MAVSDALWEIESAVDDVFDRYDDARETARTRRVVYEQALREVYLSAGCAEMYELCRWIESQIRVDERLPTGPEVRQYGSELCQQSSRRLPGQSWLGL
ncbi:hypothetical protein ACNS7O_12215 [Haloferacaceae archaeon DSL9]